MTTGLDYEIKIYSLVRRVGDAISQHTSTWMLSAELANAIAETLNCQYALIYSGPDSSPLDLQAVSSVFSDAHGFPETIFGSRLGRHLESICGPIKIDDIATDPWGDNDWPFPKTLVSWLCVPLPAGNTIRGVLCLAEDSPAAFDERTLRTLMTVVPQISHALAKISLYNNLRDSELKYRTLVEEMQDAVFICDRRWRILEVNRAASAFFGGSLVGKPLTELFVSQDAAGEFVERVRTSRAVQNLETELLAADNQKIVALMSCVAGGEKYSGHIKDVTERKQLEEQVIRTQTMEQVAALATGLARDFNNILGVIIPNAELIKQKNEAGQTTARLADLIISASKRAALVTRQLLSLSPKDAPSRPARPAREVLDAVTVENVPFP